MHEVDCLIMSTSRIVNASFLRTGPILVMHGWMTGLLQQYALLNSTPSHHVTFSCDSALDLSDGMIFHDKSDTSRTHGVITGLTDTDSCQQARNPHCNTNQIEERVTRSNCGAFKMTVVEMYDDRLCFDEDFGDIVTANSSK